MKTQVAIGAFSVAMTFSAALALAADQEAVSYVGTWTTAPVQNPTANLPSKVTLAAGGGGSAQQGGAANITVQWQQTGDQVYWFFMSEGAAFQAFRYSPSAPAGGGYSCAVTSTSINFDCQDSGYNFSMTKS
ncbi:MAG: hypothetical protein V4603_16130 [Pseudomonadota bacterium]